MLVVKYIQLGSSQLSTHPVILQKNEGPCFLIALANILLLQGRITLPHSAATSNEIMISCDSLITLVKSAADVFFCFFFLFSLCFFLSPNCYTPSLMQI
jgi:hypothetical protein